MNIRLVARTAGVSVATVSRVFNTPEVVRAETRERVLAVARRFDYVPNANARTLRTQRSRLLGVVLPTLLNPVFAEFAEGISAAAIEAGYAIQLMTTEYRERDEEAAVQHLVGRGVDGVVMVACHPTDSRALRHLRGAGMPYLLAYNRHPEHPCVSVDSESAVAQLVDMLYARGHERIAMLCGDLSASDRSRARHTGFLRGFAQLGLPAGPMVEVPFIDDTVDVAVAMLSAPGRPTALICSNDLIALRALRAAHQAGLRVPQDLSITGFDGIALATVIVPSLCTMVQPSRDMGRVCIELIAPAAAAGTLLDPRASRTLPVHLREGESVASLVPLTPA
ncbi:MAG: LacI family DNA-binding transcriptional regulator [Pseudomonadota bacterium]